MTDPLNLYNKTDSDLVILGVTIPAQGSISVPASGAVSFAKDPYCRMLIVSSSVGVSVFGLDLGTSFGGAADQWMDRVSLGEISYV